MHYGDGDKMKWLENTICEEVRQQGQMRRRHNRRRKHWEKNDWGYRKDL